ncbi:MAG TPA: hypothetical protein V6D17_22570 [Candidatus Obscuribacterales bacterium]
MRYGKFFLFAILGLALAFSLGFCQLALAAQPIASAVPPAKDATDVDNADGAQDETVEEGENNAQEGTVRVRISVPHKNRAVSTITLYPYPPRPPRIRQPIGKIDTKDKNLKAQLLNLGYAHRSALEKAYVPGSWRLQYALKAAVGKSGSRPPTNILTMYPWIWRTLPYFREEVMRINDLEAERRKRYQRAVKEFEENGSDIETEALQRGLSPLPLALKKLEEGTSQSGIAKLPSGNWWVVATHKVPGLSFFWQLPIYVNPGQNPTVLLTQSNAIVIEGGW